MKRLLAILAMAACAPTASELRAPVDRELAARTGITPAPDVDALLAHPLTPDAAARIALAANARLAEAIARLGISGGELAQALAPGPLVVEGSIRFGGAHREYEVSAIQDFSTLLVAPRRRAAARADLDAARADATALALAIAARAELALRDVIAAQQALELRETAFTAADAAATLRERMHDAGTTTDLAVARERDAREQARLDVARAQAAVEIRRTAVDAALGLSGARTVGWTAAGTLPPPPEAAPALDDLETAAAAASLALAADRARTTAAANRAGAARVAAVLPELGAGVSVLDDRDSGNTLTVGPALRLGIPLFDQKSGERAAAEARETAATARTTADATELRAHARAARIAALAAYAEARHLADIVLPLRQQIVDETLAHYNAMDADPFQLVAARRSLADAGADYLDALRRYHDAITIATALRRGVDLGQEPSP